MAEIDIAEQICLAVDQIVTERIKAINYDTTIIATIENNTYKDSGKYTCNNGSANFIAYSKDLTFEVGESVMVTIPNNDYSQQKVIIGRYVVDTLKPFDYVKPFDTMIDVSSNLVSGIGGNITSLLANEDYDLADLMESSPKNIYATSLTEFPIWSETFEQPQSGFTRLGIQGQFRSWLNALKPQALTGHYGYYLETYSYNGNIIQSQRYEKVSGLTKEEYEKNILLYYVYDAESDTYAKASGDFSADIQYYTYETIINKNDLNCLKQWCELYSAIVTKITNEKDAPDYSNLATGVIPNTPEDWFKAIKEEFNLEVSDGINIQNAFETSFKAANHLVRKDMVWAMLDAQGEFTTFEFDSLDMYGDPNNFQSFHEQEAVFDITELNSIMLMALHFYQKSGTWYDEDGNYLPYKYDEGTKYMDNLFTKDPYICLGYDLNAFDSEQAIIYCLDTSTYTFEDGVVADDNKKTIRLRWLHEFEDGAIKVITEASDLIDYEVRWYRHKNGSPSADEYSGVYWQLVHSQVVNKDTIENNAFTFVLEPQPEMADEQVKAVILYNDQVIRSNILIFENQQEVPNQATVDLLSGLSIWCDDNSYGNYYLYGQNNDLIDGTKSNEILTMKAKFTHNKVVSTIEEEDMSDGAYDLTEASKITWEFPLSNTMLVLHGFDYTNYVSLGDSYSLAGSTISVSDDGGTIIITREAVNGQINNVLDYRIRRTFSATYVNNTVKCTVEKNNMNYAATKEFSFGLMGTNGTDVTLVIDLDDNRTALSADLDEAVGVTARLYDQSHKVVDFNDLGLKLSCEWDWFAYKATTGIIIEKEILNTDGDKTYYKPHCYLSHNAFDSFSNKEEYFLIIKATVTGWGDYDLTAVKSIPIRATSQYRNVIGATEVIYDSAGNVNYYREPYEMWWCADANKINIEQDSVSSQIDIVKIENATWDITNPFGEVDNYIGTLSNKNILKPAPIYVQDTDCYGVSCYHNGNLVWIQPIYIGINQYPSATLNQWDGKYMVTDDGKVLSPAIAAGRKNKDDNTFSGVMLGDWSANDENVEFSIAGKTGLYGFDRGEQAFGFTDAGQGFIGKSGTGRIVFDGEEGTITSGAYNFDEGMKLNLALGTIDAHQFTLNAGKRRVTRDAEGNITEVSADYYDAQGEDGLDTENDPDSSLDDVYNNTIYISTEAEKYPVRVGSNFSIDWEGNIYANDGYFTGDIVGSNIYLPSKERPDFHVDENGNMYIGDVDLTSDEATFKVTSAGIVSIKRGQINLGEKTDGTYAFTADDNGKIHAESGDIGGWIIGENSLKSKNGLIELNAGKDEATTGDSTGFISAGTGFNVTTDGIMTAKGGQIGAWFFWQEGYAPANAPNNIPEVNGTRGWNSLYTVYNNKYTMFDAGRDYVIAVGVPSDQAFKDHTYAAFKVKYDGSLYIGGAGAETSFSVGADGKVECTDMKINNNTTIAGKTTIGGETTINDNLTVTGTTTIGGNTTINDNLTVNGKVAITGTEGSTITSVAINDCVATSLQVTDNFQFGDEVYAPQNFQINYAQWGLTNTDSSVRVLTTGVEVDKETLSIQVFDSTGKACSVQCNVSQVVTNFSQGRQNEGYIWLYNKTLKGRVLAAGEIVNKYES